MVFGLSVLTDSILKFIGLGGGWLLNIDDLLEIGDLILPLVFMGVRSRLVSII
jgi:hypothetical protein